MPPKVSTACRASSSTSSSRVTSVGTTKACPPSFSHSRAASFSARLLRAASTTEALRRANSWAATRPIPLDAPVITTTAFSTTGMILLPHELFGLDIMRGVTVGWSFPGVRTRSAGVRSAASPAVAKAPRLRIMAPGSLPALPPARTRGRGSRPECRSFGSTP